MTLQLMAEIVAATAGTHFTKITFIISLPSCANRAVALSKSGVMYKLVKKTVIINKIAILVAAITGFEPLLAPPNWESN